MRVDCIFCGFESYGVDGVRAHSATCNLHPLAAERDQLRAENERLRGEVDGVRKVLRSRHCPPLSGETVAEAVNTAFCNAESHMGGLHKQRDAATARAEAAERERDEASQLLRELAEILNPHDPYDRSKVLGWARDTTERAREADVALARVVDLMAALEDLLPPKREVLTEPEQRAYAAIAAVEAATEVTDAK